MNNTKYVYWVTLAFSTFRYTVFNNIVYQPPVFESIEIETDFLVATVTDMKRLVNIVHRQFDLRWRSTVIIGWPHLLGEKINHGVFVPRGHGEIAG